MNVSRRGVISLSCILTLCCGVIPVASADPADIDALIHEISDVSQQTTAKAEEVKQLEIELRDKTIEAAHAADIAAQAGQNADQARREATALRDDVNQLALAKYRGASIDQATHIVASLSPRMAVERASYISFLSERNHRIVDSLNEAVAQAAQQHTQAAAAKAEADFKVSTVRVEQARVEGEKEELDRRADEIRQRVDAFTPAERQAWINKNGPIAEVNLFGVSSSNPGGMDAVRAAMSKIGSPYGWGAAGPHQFDCSGLMVWAYQQQGKSIPRTSQAQMAGGTPVSRDALQPGDIIGYYPGATHVAMYIGNGQVVHASDYGIPVQVVPMDSMPFYGARRY